MSPYDSFRLCMICGRGTCGNAFCSLSCRSAVVFLSRPRPFPPRTRIPEHSLLSVYAVHPFYRRRLILTSLDSARDLTNHWFYYLVRICFRISVFLRAKHKPSLKNTSARLTRPDNRRDRCSEAFIKIKIEIFNTFYQARTLQVCIIWM